MITIDVVVSLLESGEDPVEVFAMLNSAGQSEFAAAGQSGFKPAFMFEVWAEEYAGQQQLVYNGREYTIYRTFGPKPDGRMELYTERRVGRK